MQRLIQSVPSAGKGTKGPKHGKCGSMVNFGFIRKFEIEIGTLLLPSINHELTSLRKHKVS